MLTPEERFFSALIVIVGPAITAHVQYKNIEQRPVTKLAIDPPAAIGTLQTHRRIFKPGLACAAHQAVDIFVLVTRIQLLARRPVVHHFVVVPLPDLRDLGVEATDVFVHQVVAIVAAILIEGLGDFALGLGGDVAPHTATFCDELFRDRTVGVNGVAAVDKKVWQTQAHCFVDAHAANVRVDAEALADGVAAPDKTDVTAGVGHAAQVTEPGLAGNAALGVLELHSIENRLVGGQPGKFDPGSEIGACIGQGRDESPRVGKQAAGVPLHHHPRGAVAAAPDDRPVTQQVAGLHAIGELRPILDRSDHRRRQPRQQQPGADRLHDTTAPEVEIAHGVLPGKGKLKHDPMTLA
ncbi:hypothetical protein D3C81_826810 [compost metagenome]